LQQRDGEHGQDDQRSRILEMVRSSAAREKPYGWLNYQPIDLPGYEETVPLRGRDCFDRARAVFDHLEAELGPGPHSLVDWGCNLGFFVFEAARRGHQAAGYDSDRRLVETGRFLAAGGGFRQRPLFEQRTLGAEAARQAPAADVLLCFSVLHHLPEKEAWKVLEAVSNRYRAAYIEMDGHEHGRSALELFFYRVELVVETHDRYGSGRRHRKTWFCSNRQRHCTYRNLKTRDHVFRRSVFLATEAGGQRSVLKRERRAGPWSHTWLKTNLAHEREVYQRHPGPCFPRLLDSGEGEVSWLRLEYLEAQGLATPAAVDALFSSLAEERLFILDFRVDGFLVCKDRLMMFDLESVFPVEGTLAETVARHLINPAWAPRSLGELDSYQKQAAALKRHLFR
jgi:hypothetical protein